MFLVTAGAAGRTVDVSVVAMQGWNSSLTFPQGLPWVLPSPNMPTLHTAFLYPGMCFLEGTVVYHCTKHYIYIYILHSFCFPLFKILLLFYIPPLFFDSFFLNILLLFF